MEDGDNTPVLHLKVTPGMLWMFAAAVVAFASSAASAGYYFNSQVVSRIDTLERGEVEIRQAIERSERDRESATRDRQDQINALRDEVYEYIFHQRPPKEFKR